MGSIVLIHRPKKMSKAKTYERRISKLLKYENGKRIHDGTFWFPYEESALKLVELAEDFGMSTTKEILFRKKHRIPQIMIFKDMKGKSVSPELKAAEARAEKKLKKVEREAKKFVKEFMTAGTEHQA